MARHTGAGALLREGRVRRGLSQRALAERAGVPQPTIAAIEAGRRRPSFDLFVRIVERGGLPIRVVLSEPPAWGAAGAGAQIVRFLADEHRREQQRHDSALRTVLDLRDTLLRTPAGELGALVSDRAELSGDRRWDAFLAGVVEEATARHRVPPPAWTQEPERFVEPFWHLSDSEAFHEWERETAPAALLRHGVLAAAGELESR